MLLLKLSGILKRLQPFKIVVENLYHYHLIFNPLLEIYFGISAIKIQRNNFYCENVLFRSRYILERSCIRDTLVFHGVVFIIEIGKTLTIMY